MTRQDSWALGMCPPHSLSSTLTCIVRGLVYKFVGTLTHIINLGQYLPLSGRLLVIL